ncbi:PTS system fructose-specific IIC component [Oryzihumus leptocrescens]|uniref:PTS system fructose-specific IIC component n=2 Tax=Oryzihumus leptocrescens TaxID=297536 RepID=A0A542ZJN3_9MICO|nr:fructose-specific PTS transporter subunit EIIC [Oryzihumus leptocrescens]TQL60509.1 PTS system fructose-specific IIC component [Oryzihumus leptocrescens]
MKFVAVTSCPTGIAHTYMAAESLEQSAKDAGHEIAVETQGSAGSQPLPADVIAAADAVIFAADVEVRERQRFAGKPLVQVGVKKAISDGPGLIAQAVAAAEEAAAHPEVLAAAAAPASGGGLATKVDSEAGTGTRIRQWLMTGVSYMIPFVAAGGILIALSFMLAQIAGGKRGAIAVVNYNLTGTGVDAHWNLATNFNLTSGMDWAGLLFVIGAASFGFLVPILSGFIAFAIADRPGIAPGIVGGFIAATMGAGFLGGIATGFVGGFTALWISRRKVPKGVRGIMPVVVIPLVSTAITGAALILVLGRPIKAISDGLTSWLNGLTGTNLVILGIILGLMMGFDLGGPVNKVAYTFATTGLATAAATAAAGGTPLKVMAAVMAAGMTPPLGMALATTIRPGLFSEPERENGRAAWLLGASFISEGAIPFAAADPWRVIVSSMSGSAVAGALVMLFGSTLRAPHGGIWVVPLIGAPLLFLLAIAVGTCVTTAVVVALKSTAKTTDADLVAEPAATTTAPAV